MSAVSCLNNKQEYILLRLLFPYGREAAGAEVASTNKFERIEAHAQRCEDRRDKLLQQIEWRRIGAARAVLSSSKDPSMASTET